MRAPRVVFFAVLLAASTCFCLGAELRTALANKSSDTPVLDGYVGSDPVWARVTPLGSFTLLGKEEPATAQTQVRLLYDDRALYIGFSCALPAGAQIQATARPRDLQVYVDECVEVFLAPDPTHPQSYFHFIVNAAGSIQDELGRDPEWNPSWQAKTAMSNGGWEVEMCIAWAELPLTASTGSIWRANFCRHCPAVSENSCWAPCKQSFHEPEHFGQIDGLDVDFSPIARGRLLKQIANAADAATSLARTSGQGKLANRARLVAGQARRNAEELQLETAQAPKSELPRLEAQAQALQAQIAEARRLTSRVAMAEAARRVMGEEGWAVCVESPMRKIPAYEDYTGEPARQVRIELARNEYEGAQLVIVSLGEKLDEVAVEATQLRGPGGAVLGGDKISLRRIAYVNVTQSSGRAVLKPGLLPDPLLPYTPEDVRENAFLPLLLTVHAPEDQTPGLYQGEIVIQPRGHKPWRVKLAVTVWDFALPRASLLRTCFNLNSGFLPRYHDVWDGKTPPGWSFAQWVGADMQGIPDYFGEAEFDHGVTTDNPHSGNRCAWITCTNWRKGTKEAPRAAYMFSLDLKPGRYVFALAHRTAGDGVQADFGISGVTWHALPPSSQWQETSYPFQINQQGKVYFYLRLLNPGQVWFDSVRLADEHGNQLAPNPGFEHIGKAMLPELLSAYRTNMLAHRASDMNVAAPVITVREDEVHIDWRDFDSEMERYLRLGLNAFNVHWARVSGGWGTVAEIDESDRETRVAAEILRQTEAHLAEKGWLDLAYLYVIDEPGAKYFPQVKRIFDFVHKAAPRLKRLLTYGYGASRPIVPGKPVYADLAGFVDIHVPHSDCFEQIYLDQRQKLGEEIWVYVCISAQRPHLNIWGIDYPGTDHRVLFWQLFRYRATGFLYWAVTYWPEDPWQNPMTYPGGNADGSLLYPGVDGPVDSLRWEITRDGIEDYDYLALAQQWARKARAAKKTQLAERLEALCDTADVTKSWVDYTEDPAVIMAHRRRLGQALSEAARELRQDQ
jgi:hypothetical protein